MSYLSVVEMAGSTSLMSRITAAAASLGVAYPDQWTKDNIWAVVSDDPDWSAAWDYARDTQTADDNPDTGMRPGVINDTMISTVVTTIISAPPGP